MAFLPRDRLLAMGFRALGQHVLISDRAAIYGAERMELGDHMRVDDFSVLSGRLVFGRNVHVSVQCNVAGGREGVEFGDFSGLSPGCQVFTETDDYTGLGLTNPTVPDRYRRVTATAVSIGRHCILGAGAMVLPGVTLAEGCSVGALSMVTRSTEAWSIYAGAPARRLRARNRELLEHERAYLEEERCAPSAGRP